MKRGIGMLGGLLFAALCWAEPAAAQGLPQGSYLRSCNGVSLQGDNLIATCRRADGREQRTSLAGVHRCVGATRSACAPAATGSGTHSNAAASRNACTKCTHSKSTTAAADNRGARVASVAKR